jgi:mRNA interferase MazF
VKLIALMTSFDVGDIVVVDYPHVETNLIKRRPALVVSTAALGPNGLVLWAVMITSAANRRWPGDIEIEDHGALGLPIPSVFRTEKIATMERDGAEKIGRTTTGQLAEVQAKLAGFLGLASA